MLLTEEYARGKVCCGPGSGTPNCQASMCMAWRWADPVLILPATGETVCRRYTDANTQENRPAEQRRGFCGLAGWGEVE